LIRCPNTYDITGKLAGNRKKWKFKSKLKQFEYLVSDSPDASNLDGIKNGGNFGGQ